MPGTHEADGDALDLLVLSDEPLFPLCLVQARLIRVIEAEQTQEGKTFRNDRMVAVAVGSRLYAKVSDLDDLPPTLMDEIEQYLKNRISWRNVPEVFAKTHYAKMSNEIPHAERMPAIAIGIWLRLRGNRRAGSINTTATPCCGPSCCSN